MNQHIAADATQEAIKATPPLAVMGATIGGFALQDWVFILTLVYLVVQIGWLLWKWWKAWSTKDWVPNGSE